MQNKNLRPEDSFEMIGIWALALVTGISIIGAIYYGEASQLGLIGRVLAVTAALSFVATCTVAFGRWAWRRQARADLLNEWMRFCAQTGQFSPHSVDALVETIAELQPWYPRLGRPDRLQLGDVYVTSTIHARDPIGAESIIRLIYALEELFSGRHRLLAEDAMGATETLRLIGESATYFRVERSPGDSDS